jgi:hypothetical protein
MCGELIRSGTGGKIPASRLLKNDAGRGNP